MKFAKIISCGDMKMEITANTHALIKIVDKKREYTVKRMVDELDFDEFVKIYGNITVISEIVHDNGRLITEIPFLQVDFWKSFCYVLSESRSVGFLGLKGSVCLTNVCSSLVPEKIWCGPFEEDWASYSRCKDIVVSDSYNIVIIAEYGEEGEKSTCIKYPYDYLELLENVESYLAQKTAPIKMLFQKEAKSPELCKGDQMIMDFLEANKKEIRQFKRYVSKLTRLKEIYRDLLIEGSLIVDGKGFSEKYCGFDIYRKKEEIDAIVKKLQNSSDAGEEKVEYAIKWLSVESSLSFKTIKKNCETKYRYGSILLKNSEFIDVPQEYDHILVSDAGIILIETKYWKGRVKIYSDGKWVRDPNNNGCLEGVENPFYQIQRHEALMKSILPHVPIHSLLVFSNPTLILEGAENCNMCRVLYVDRLKETIMDILSDAQPVGGTSDFCVDEIEKYKINIMGDDVRELK